MVERLTLFRMSLVRSQPPEPSFKRPWCNGSTRSSNLRSQGSNPWGRANTSRWQIGYAAACKAAQSGSTPERDSIPTVGIVQQQDGAL